MRITIASADGGDLESVSGTLTLSTGDSGNSLLHTYLLLTTCLLQNQKVELQERRNTGVGVR